MAKYERAKKLIIKHMKESGVDVMTSHDMVEIVKYKANGQPRQIYPRANDLAQSVRRDVRFRHVGFTKVVGLDGDKQYEVMLWELSDRA